MSRYVSTEKEAHEVCFAVMLREINYVFLRLYFGIPGLYCVFLIVSLNLTVIIYPYYF